MVDTSTTPTIDWQAHRQFFILLAALILLSIPMLSDLISDWYHDGNYSHGFLVIPISVWLFMRRQKELSAPTCDSSLGIVVLILGCLGLIFGVAATEYFTTRVSLVMMVTGLSLFYLGRENFSKVWFAFAFLLFMIPIPAILYYAATGPMQLLASQVTAQFLEILGVAVSRQGVIITLPDGYRLEVAEACSGLRSLVALMAMSALYSYTRLKGKVIPVVVFIASLPIAIAANVFRVMMTALAAYAISTSVAEGIVHEISGMLVFVFSLIMIVILGGVLQWAQKRLS